MKPEEKKLKQRADGRYRATYHGMAFYAKSMDEALQKRDEYKKLVESGMQTQQITVAKFASQWLPIARPNVADKTYNGYARLIDLLIDVIGELNLSMVKPLDIKKVYSISFRDSSESYIKKAKYLYTAMFNAAVANRYMDSNPCTNSAASPHKGKASQVRRAITAEERYYIETTPHRIQPIAMLMLYAGLRDSEAIPIDVDRDIDFENRVIHLRKFRHTKHNKAYINEKGKTLKATRDIGLFPQLANYLQGYHGLVVSMKDGSVLSDCAWRRGWQSFVHTIERRMNGCSKRWYGKRRVDIERKGKYNQLMAEGRIEEAGQYKPLPWRSFTVTPYLLRHSFCSYCRDMKVEVNVCREWMGHSDLKMIMQIYDHVSDERKAAELQRIYDNHDAKLGQRGSENIL